MWHALFIQPYVIQQENISVPCEDSPSKIPNRIMEIAYQLLSRHRPLRAAVQLLGDIPPPPPDNKEFSCRSPLFELVPKGGFGGNEQEREVEMRDQYWRVRMSKSTFPSFTTTHPTAGLGSVFPRPLLASSSACSMYCLSSSVTLPAQGSYHNHAGYYRGSQGACCLVQYTISDAECYFIQTFLECSSALALLARGCLAPMTNKYTCKQRCMVADPAVK